GDADQAVTRLAAWSSAQVEQEAVPFVQAHVGDPWVLAAVMLLHTDAGLHRHDLGEALTPRPLQKGQQLALEEIEIHGRQVLVLLDVLSAAAVSDPALVTFLRDWHILVGRDLWGRGGDFPPVLASQRFPSDAASWLLFGSHI